MSLEIVKLYRQTVAAKKIGEGRSVTKAKYVAGRSGRVAVLKVQGHTAYLSMGIARNNRQDLMLKHGTDRPKSLTGQQFRSVWVQAKHAQSSVVLGSYTAEKQRAAHYA